MSDVNPNPSQVPATPASLTDAVANWAKENKGKDLSKLGKPGKFGSGLFVTYNPKDGFAIKELNVITKFVHRDEISAAKFLRPETIKTIKDSLLEAITNKDIKCQQAAQSIFSGVETTIHEESAAVEDSFAEDMRELVTEYHTVADLRKQLDGLQGEFRFVLMSSGIQQDRKVAAQQEARVQPPAADDVSDERAAERDKLAAELHEVRKAYEFFKGERNYIQGEERDQVFFNDRLGNYALPPELKANLKALPYPSTFGPVLKVLSTFIAEKELELQKKSKPFAVQEKLFAADQAAETAHKALKSESQKVLDIEDKMIELLDQIAVKTKKTTALKFSSTTLNSLDRPVDSPYQYKTNAELKNLLSGLKTKEQRLNTSETEKNEQELAQVDLEISHLQTAPTNTSEEGRVSADKEVSTIRLQALNDRKTELLALLKPKIDNHAKIMDLEKEMEIRAKLRQQRIGEDRILDLLSGYEKI